MESTTIEGSYREATVVDIIRNHNLEVQGLAGYDSVGSLPPY